MTITINVARSADEAERLARGENVTVRREGGDEEDEAAAKEAATAAAEAFFEPGAGKDAEAEEDKGQADEAAAEAGEEIADRRGGVRSVEDVELLRRRLGWRAGCGEAGGGGCSLRGRGRRQVSAPPRRGRVAAAAGWPCWPRLRGGRCGLCSPGSVIACMAASRGRRLRSGLAGARRAARSASPEFGASRGSGRVTDRRLDRRRKSGTVSPGAGSGPPRAAPCARRARLLRLRRRSAASPDSSPAPPRFRGCWCSARAGSPRGRLALALGQPLRALVAARAGAIGGKQLGRRLGAEILAPRHALRRRPCWAWAERRSATSTAGRQQRDAAPDFGRARRFISDKTDLPCRARRLRPVQAESGL